MYIFLKLCFKTTNFEKNNITIYICIMIFSYSLNICLQKNAVRQKNRKQFVKVLIFLGSK